jgi:hypothetical protein
MSICLALGDNCKFLESHQLFQQKKLLIQPVGFSTLLIICWLTNSTIIFFSFGNISGVPFLPALPLAPHPLSLSWYVLLGLLFFFRLAPPARLSRMRSPVVVFRFRDLTYGMGGMQFCCRHFSSLLSAVFHEATVFYHFSQLKVIITMSA